MFVLPLTSSFHFHWIPTLLYAAHKRAFIACFSSLAGVVDGPTHDGMILVVMWFRKCPVQWYQRPNQSWVNYLQPTVPPEHEYTQCTRGFGDETLGPQLVRYHSQTVRYCPQSSNFQVHCSLIHRCTAPPLPVLPPNMRGFFASLLAVGRQNGGSWRKQQIINRFDPFWAELALVLCYWSRRADSVLSS